MKVVLYEEVETDGCAVDKTFLMNLSMPFNFAVPLPDTKVASSPYLLWAVVFAACVAL